MDAYTEELAFPTIYMGVPSKIIGPRSTPFAMASSEIRRTDWRGATPEHVLYMAAKVMRYSVAESNMMFRTNEATGSITREQLESGGKKFLEEVLDRDLAFMRGVPNTVQYWQDHRSELFAMIRQLCKPHAFLTMSAFESTRSACSRPWSGCGLGPTARLGPCPRCWPGGTWSS
ncbi:hypothetical protein MRX96_008045 [Rhipicephalus microplus]